MKFVLREVVRVVVPLLVLAAAAAGFFAIVTRAKEPPAEPREAEPPLVSAGEVTSAGTSLDVEVDGLVVPYREVALSAEVAGRVTYKSRECRAGQYVEADTLLVEIDPREYELELKRLEVNLAELEKDEERTRDLLTLAEEDLQLRQRDYARVEQLRASNAASVADLDAARRSVNTAKNSAFTLQKQLQLLDIRQESLQLQIRRASLDLSRTRITAPIAGFISADRVEQDAYVQPGSHLLTIEDTSAVEVRSSLRMDELKWLWRSAARSGGPDSEPGRAYAIPATPVTVVYRLDGQRYEWDGVLVRYEGAGIDERTRTVPCRVLVRDPWRVRSPDGGPGLGGPRTLMRGMFVGVVIHVETPIPLLRLPETALRPGEEVWVYRPDERRVGSSSSEFERGTLRKVRVQVARYDEGTVLVTADAGVLQPGDRVATSQLAHFSGEHLPVRVNREAGR